MNILPNIEYDVIRYCDRCGKHTDQAYIPRWNKEYNLIDTYQCKECNVVIVDAVSAMWI